MFLFYTQYIIFIYYSYAGTTSYLNSYVAIRTNYSRVILNN